MNERPTAALKNFRALPKVELHRHLKSTLRLETMFDIAQHHKVTIPEDLLDLSSLVQMQDDEAFSFQ